MPQYPVPLDKRHAATMADFRQRITRLETRTACIDSGFPLAALPATIDPTYTTGQPKAYFSVRRSTSTQTKVRKLPMWPRA